MIKVGLEAISFDVPQCYVSMTELAHARGIDPVKYTAGLGQKEMAVASPSEDTVTLAAGAGKNLLDYFHVDPETIALVIVGTETGVDQSKPVSIYTHQLLGLPQSCRAFEVKHACYGAMAGLSMAINWILSGRAKGKKALVIASDIARYGINTPGEPTQGAGAVAMLISDQPKLLEFHTQEEGFYSKQVMDFWRPNYSKEALVDGHYSISCYLDALAGAYQQYKKEAVHNLMKGNKPVPEEPFSGRFEACLYHVPFVKMAQKAHQKLFEMELGSTIEKGSPHFELFLNDLHKRVSPFLELNARVGNIYTGSLFMSLFNYLQDRRDMEAGKIISLFSYGSGCNAEFMSATVMEDAPEILKKHDFRRILEARKKIDITTYEKMLTACEKADHNNSGVCNPEAWEINKPILYTGTQNHKRQYLMR